MQLFYAGSVFCWMLVANASLSQTYNYEEDIRPLMVNHCLACHQEKSITPITLDTYESVSSQAAQILYMVETRKMPPWKAAPSYRHFTNERIITADEIHILKSWVEDGMKRGSFSHEDHEMPYHEVPEALGAPDVSLRLIDATRIRSSSQSEIELLALKVAVKDSHLIKAIEFVPAKNGMVRHAYISLLDSAQMVHLEWRDQPSFVPFPVMYSWTPDAVMMVSHNVYPLLTGEKWLVVQLNHSEGDQPCDVTSRVNLYFEKTCTSKGEMYTSALISPSDQLPDSTESDSSDQIYQYSVLIGDTISIYSLYPRMEASAASLEVFATPSGQSTPIKILLIPHWDAQWQDQYVLINPVVLYPGATIHAKVRISDEEEDIENIPVYIDFNYAWQSP